VSAFDFVVDCFADVVKESGTFGRPNVEAHLGGHHTHEVRDFDGVFEDVLGKAVAEFQAAEKFDDLEVHRGNTGAADGVFAGADDGFIHFLRDFGHDLLDARRMDAAIQPSIA